MILDDRQRRAMEFIAAVNKSGYRPTGREINQWRLHPGPKPARPGRVLEPAIPAEPDRRVRKRRSGTSHLGEILGPALAATDPLRDFRSNAAGSLARVLKDLEITKMVTDDVLRTSGLASLVGHGLWEYETIPGKPGKAAVHAPDKPAEKFLAHLRRLGWISRDHQGRYDVTGLGYALLASESASDSEQENSSVIVLAPEDQNLGYGTVLGRVATCGDTLVADPYLGVHELRDLLEHTDTSRFLIGPKLKKSQVVELAVHVRNAEPTADGVARELRLASFHDRYLVGEQDVFTLTTSLNGVSKSSMALLVEMPSVAAAAIRGNVEDLWEGAEVLASGPSTEDLEAETIEDDGDSDERAVEEIDGKFTHDGCEIKHKTNQTALNCTQGS